MGQGRLLGVLLGVCALSEALADDLVGIVEVLGVLALSLALVRHGGWPEEMLRQGPGHVHLGLDLGGFPLHLAHICTWLQHTDLLADRNILLGDCGGLCVLGLGTEPRLPVSLYFLLGVDVKIESLLDFVRGR